MILYQGTRIRVLPPRDEQGRVVHDHEGITGREGTVAASVVTSVFRGEEEAQIEVVLGSSVRCVLPDYRVSILRNAEAKRV